MYTLIRENMAPPAGTTGAKSVAGRRVSATVILLGLTSLFTDISSEMVTTVLPLYFIVHLQLTPVYFGLIDGIYQGVSFPLRLLGGHLSDRLQRHKEVAAAGYGISSICKLGLLVVGGAWVAISGVLILDRLGKAIRTGPRDAMISLSTPEGSLGTAFGVHRAMDSVGALLGPVVAFTILEMAPGAFDSIFVVSFCVSLIGLGIIVLLVRGRSAVVEQPVERASLRAGFSLFNEPQFRRIFIVSISLGLFTISDGFLYLVLQKQLDLDFGFFPLLYLGTATAYFVLAMPAGMLADRIGRAKVMLAGYVILLLVYSALLRRPEGTVEIGIYLLLFGAYYAATDGVLMALASKETPGHLRASGLAIIGSAAGFSRFGGALLFGGMWTLWGSDTAVAVTFAGLSLSLIFAIYALRDRARSQAAAA